MSHPTTADRALARQYPTCDTRECRSRSALRCEDCNSMFCRQHARLMRDCAKGGVRQDLILCEDCGDEYHRCAVCHVAGTDVRERWIDGDRRMACEACVAATKPFWDGVVLTDAPWDDPTPAGVRRVAASVFAERYPTIHELYTEAYGKAARRG